MSLLGHSGGAGFPLSPCLAIAVFRALLAMQGRAEEQEKMRQRKCDLLLSLPHKAASGIVFNHRISFPGSYFATQRRICLALSELAAGS